MCKRRSPRIYDHWTSVLEFIIEKKYNIKLLSPIELEASYPYTVISTLTNLIHPKTHQHVFMHIEFKFIRTRTSVWKQVNWIMWSWLHDIIEQGILHFLNLNKRLHWFKKCSAFLYLLQIKITNKRTFGSGSTHKWKRI